jgi:hypothetical protein
MPVCGYCEEPLEGGRIIGNTHQECAMRTVVGSVAHIEKRCSCYVPGSEEGDPPGMTLREAARAAVAAHSRWVQEKYLGKV